MTHSKYYESGRRAVFASITLSVLAMVGSTLFMPLLITEMDQAYQFMREESALFKLTSNEIWSELMKLNEAQTNWNKGTAQQMYALNRVKRQESFLDRLERKSFKGRRRLLQHITNPKEWNKNSEKILFDENETYEALQNAPTNLIMEPAATTLLPSTTTTASTTISETTNQIRVDASAYKDEYNLPQTASSNDAQSTIRSTNKCPRGPPGVKGQDGINGEAGINGLPGKKGLSGLSSSTNRCYKCPQGPPGNTGKPGNMGEPGIQGPPGTPGLPTKGVPGKPGDIGDEGVEGLPGKSGLNGLPGNSSIQFIGTPGSPGSPGLPGKVGEIGDNGEDGINGLQGSPGLIGQVGLHGEPGSNGQNGLAGAPGNPGRDQHYCNCPLRSIYLQALKNQNIPVGNYLRRFKTESNRRKDDDIEAYKRYNTASIPYYRLLK